MATDSNEHNSNRIEFDGDPSLVLGKLKDGTDPEQREAASQFAQAYLKAAGRNVKKVTVKHHPDFENVLMVEVVEGKDDEEPSGETD